MKRYIALAASFAAVLAACGGGGGSSDSGSPTPSPAPAPAPTPSPPPPPPPGAGAAGTWTAPLSTCTAPDTLAHPELGPNSLGNITCVVGTYYAKVIVEGFSSTGDLVGKDCNLSIGADATFTVTVGGNVVATYPKTVTATIAGVEQSGYFNYGFLTSGGNEVVNVIQYYNGGSAQVIINPAQLTTDISIPFYSPTSKLQIQASYGAAPNTTYLTCEG